MQTVFIQLEKIDDLCFKRWSVPGYVMSAACGVQLPWIQPLFHVLTTVSLILNQLAISVFIKLQIKQVGAAFVFKLYSF